MSHTFKWGDARTGIFRIHFNSDFSGTIKIVSIDADGFVGSSVDVPAQLLLEFVSEIVRSKRISELERSTAARILGLNDTFLPP